MFGGLGEVERRFAIDRDVHFFGVRLVVTTDAEDAPNRDAPGLPAHRRRDKSRGGKQKLTHSRPLKRRMKPFVRLCQGRVAQLDFRVTHPAAAAQVIVGERNRIEMKF